MLQTFALVLVGTICLARVEMLSRTQDTFIAYMTNASVFLLVAQFCLYMIFNKAPNVMTAWITWTVTMALIRVLNSHFILKEGLDLRWILAGVAMMVIASLCIKQA